MRLLLLAPLVLLLALAGCSDDGGASDSDGDGSTSGGRSDVDLDTACDALDDETASALVGVAVTRRDSDLPGGASCTWFDAADEGALNVVVVAEDGSFDSLEDLAGPEVETAPVEVAGAEEAITVDDDAANLASTSLIARGDGVVLTAYPSGLTREDQLRLGTAALTVLLGGEPDPAAAVDRRDVPHPCDQVTQAEARDALGLGVTATRSDSGSTRLCLYDDGEVSVTVIDLGRAQRVDQAAAATGGEPPEQVDAPPPLTAFAAVDAEAAAVQLAVATDVTVLGISVDGVDGVEARRLAEALLPALVP